MSEKKFLNSIDVKIQGGGTLFDVFREYLGAERYNNLIVCLSPSLKSPEVYAQILLSDPRNLLVFHEETG